MKGFKQKNPKNWIFPFPFCHTLPIDLEKCAEPLIPSLDAAANLLHGLAGKTRKGQIVVIFGQLFSQEMENELSSDLLSYLETRLNVLTRS